MNDKTSLTALMSAFGRAYYTEEEGTVFADTVAKKLFSAEEYKKIGEYILGGTEFFAPDKKGCFKTEGDALRYLVNTQIAPTPVARARFCEDGLKTAVYAGAKQYVILGAGLDTFAFRNLHLIKSCKVFEVDHPKTQADKIARIGQAGLNIPDELVFVPVDFSKDDLAECLIKAGFDAEKKSFFSWLGVSYYLGLTEIERMLAAIAGLSSDGSSLVFDYADEGLFSSKVRRVQNMLAMAAAGGEPMKTSFSYAELERLLEKHGFLIYELMTSADIQNQYFNGTDITAFEHINFVNAAYKNAARKTPAFK